MRVENLIQQNNEKRELLNEKNKEIYEDFMIYVRTDFRIAEQESEEVLLDILNHLLDVQESGEEAEALFGKDPKKFADDLIEQLPSEKIKAHYAFISSQLFKLLSYFFVFSGLAKFIIPFFTPINHTLSFGDVLVGFMSIVLFVVFAIWLVMFLIRRSLFKERPQKGKVGITILVGIGGGIVFFILLFLQRLIPSFGPTFEVKWWVLIVLGGAAYLISKLLWNQIKAKSTTSNL